MDSGLRQTGMASTLMLVLACSALPARAQALYKCESADGSIAFQDRRCPADSTTLPLPPSTPMRGLVPESGSYALPHPAPTPAAPATVFEPPTPPALYRCQSADGRHYASSNPNPPGRYVPLWTLDCWPSIKGRVGAPPPNPQRVGSPKPVPTPGGPRLQARGGWPVAMGTGYTWMQDQCMAMGRGESCAYWRGEIDRVGAARRIAFRDTRASLDGQYRDLRERLETYCR